MIRTGDVIHNSITGETIRFVETAAYPPSSWRANAPAMNHPAFGPAFACKAGQAMAPAAATQVALWR